MINPKYELRKFEQYKYDTVRSGFSAYLSSICDDSLDRQARVRKLQQMVV